jgi:hypothetical protein
MAREPPRLAPVDARPRTRAHLDRGHDSVIELDNA